MAARRKKKPSAGRAPDASADAPPPPLQGGLPVFFRALLFLGAAFYLAMVFLDTTGWAIVEKIPRPIHYFGQIACLFPKAGTVVIDYRAEGWLCKDKRWVEVDVRPYFPIDREEKENRFQRTIHFFRTHRETLQALDDYIVSHHNETVRAAGTAPGPGERGIIGGIRVSSLRIPFGKPGDKVERWTRKPILDHPREIKADFFWTRKSKRRERCVELVPGYDDRGIEDSPLRPAPSEERDP